MDDGDNDFVTESESSSQSDPSEIELHDNQTSLDSDSDDEADLERSLELYRIEDESIADRIYALRDIINPSTRESICQCWNSLWDKSTSSGKAFGNFAWVMTTSIILVGLPMALSIEAESMLVAQEKEMERQQQSQHVSTQILNPTAFKDAVTEGYSTKQTLTTPGLGTNPSAESTSQVPSVFS